MTSTSGGRGDLSDRSPSKEGGGAAEKNSLACVLTFLIGNVSLLAAFAAARWLWFHDTRNLECPT